MGMSSWTSFHVPFTVVCFDPIPLFENSDNTETYNILFIHHYENNVVLFT